MQKVDLKKELKHLYGPSLNEVSLVDVPKMNFVMVDGSGDPNKAKEYQEAIEALYSISYTIKFAVKKEQGIDFVVMPLEDVDFDAGVTSITEAMAMGKAVIVTRNRGQVDVVRDNVDGLYVPPRDPRALREAIEHLLTNPDEARRMGAAGRQAVLDRHRLDDYTARVASIIRAASE